MKPRWYFAFFLACLCLATLLPSALADDRGESPLDPAPPKGITPEEIIKRFAAKEKEFAEARNEYAYEQDVKVQTLDGDTVDGEYREVFDVTFDDKGRKIRQVVFAPQSSLERIQMTQQDMNDIENLLPFVLTSDEIPEYNIIYAGQQQEDELHTYVFDIAPKQIEKNKRYFQGRVWVDDHDFQIVKTSGKTVPDIRKKGQENLFPKFTTWREQVDGRYWFPTYTRADDTLHFTGNDVRVREIVKYSKYKRFGSKVKITYEGQELPQGQQPPGQQPQGQQGQGGGSGTQPPPSGTQQQPPPKP